MQQKLSRATKGIRLLLLAILALLPSLRLAAADGDVFKVDGILYQVISEADKTCRTMPGTRDEAGNKAYNGPTLTLPATLYGYTLIEVGNYSFMGNYAKKIVIPEGVQFIGQQAFKLSYNLTSVELPSTLTRIGKEAFSGCGALKSIRLPEGFKSLGEQALGGAYALTSIYLPEGLEEIGRKAFFGCYNLKTLTIPSTVESFGYSAFDTGSVFDSLIIKGSYSVSPNKDMFFNLKQGSVVLCRAESYDALKESGITSQHKLFTYDNPYHQYTREANGVTCLVELEDNNYCQVKSSDYKVALTDTAGKVIKTLNIDKAGVNLIDGLSLGTDYILKFSWLGDGTYCGYSYKIRTKDEPVIGVKATVRDITETSFTITDIIPSFNDPDVNYVDITEKGYYFLGEKYKFKDKVTISKLLPAEEFTIFPYIIYKYKDKEYEATGSESLYTKKLNVTLKNQAVGPTSIQTFAVWNNDNIGFAAECWWEMNGEKIQGKSADFVNLTPETTYSPVFKVWLKSEDYGEKTFVFRFVKDFTTSKLTLNTLVPKCVSSTCAIVAAETNILDVEPSVGFQWKKYDAPSTLAPSEGYGAVCDGMVEGYIRNLQSTSYYNVRAFYKTAKGTYYYGQWITFDPSDFSFFEPSVRTYPVQEVGDNRASVRGYALAGTEDIKSQGFQYWPSNSPQSAKMYAQASSEVYTVLASGQIMTATLDDLLPATTYTYRAFVETATGFTYGDEQTFTTTDISGIGAIDAEPQQLEIIGYFDLSGRRYTTLQRGVNIIVYSDGTTRKVIRR